MAIRRMFSQTVVNTDSFLELPLSAQALYFHLGMRADDDGFVSAPRLIMRTIGATPEDLDRLIKSNFVIAFASGIIVITSWKLNNYLRADRYTPTIYTEERNQLKTDQNGTYQPVNGDGIPVVYQRYTQDSIGKDSIGKDRLDSLENEHTGWYTSGIPAVYQDAAEAIANDISLYLSDGSLYTVEPEYIAEMQRLHPTIDVMQELRLMEAWTLNNPKKRKSRDGVKAFIGRWLNRVQEKGQSDTDNVFLKMYEEERSK